MHATKAMCFAGAVIFAAASNQNAAIVPPVGLPIGSQYQLVFVTRGTLDATSLSISQYNTFVNEQASLNAFLPSGVTWDAVGSTGRGSFPGRLTDAVIRRPLLDCLSTTPRVWKSQQQRPGSTRTLC